ncbi:MAG: nitrate reductase cytochrome c-type subunit [Candidatus Pelagadaptatus aseana]|uniref:nitrate reductase cytochrome c-type subunit n=1 Tax=Candidatus Pelagadaptatus aseana TaxID=3120508 RepID=UPI0039B33DAD
MKQLILLASIVLSMSLGMNTQADIDQGHIANARGNTSVASSSKPPAMPPVVNTDIKQKRDYPMQPPLIPHKTDHYQVDANANKCMACHSRRQTEESQAPMVSVTHYMDRDGNFLAEVSPRRYFCNQCHVTQTNAKPLMENTFVDMDTLLEQSLKEKSQ